MEKYLLHDWPGNVRELREEVRRLGEIMRARKLRQLETMIPPVEEACGPRLHTPKPGEHRQRFDDVLPTPKVDPAEQARVTALLLDPLALAQAIQVQAQGNVKDFSERVAQILGRNPGTIRRQIYRVLGTTLADIREGDRNT